VASLAPSALPRFLLERPGAYTHLLSPDTYIACMGAMGWGAPPGRAGPWVDANLRHDGDQSHPVVGLRLTVALAAVEGGSILCVNAADLELAMGGGLVTYDYGACELEFRRAYCFLHGRRGVEVMLRGPASHIPKVTPAPDPGQTDL